QEDEDAPANRGGLDPRWFRPEGHRRAKLPTPSCKHQTQSSKEIPSSKQHSAPVGGAIEVWCLEISWCVVFGVWCLVCGVWCVVFGVWCLVFFISPIPRQDILSRS